MFVVRPVKTAGGAGLSVVSTSTSFHRDVCINALKLQLTMSQVLIFLLLLCTSSRVLFFCSTRRLIFSMERGEEKSHFIVTNSLMFIAIYCAPGLMGMLDYALLNLGHETLSIRR